MEEVSPSAPIFTKLKDQIKNSSGESTLLLLGDIIDENGMSKNLTDLEKQKLKSINDLVAIANRTIFVPGDREWDDGGENGFKKVKAIENYFNKKNNAVADKITVTPSEGCLGPEIIDVGDFLRIVTVNTQWLVHQYDRPEEENINCPAFNEVEFWDELEDAIEDSENRNVIVAAHHPILSYGQYAGYKLTKKSLSPPIIGSFIAGYHQSVGSKKDLIQEGLEMFSKELLKRLERYPSIIYASGHEYDIQLNYRDGSYHLNSGAVEKAKPTARGKFTAYRQSERGFAQLQFFNTGEVRTKIWEIEEDESFKIEHEQVLFQSPCNNDLTKTNAPINEQFNPCKVVEKFIGKDHPLKGNAIAGSQFEAGKLKTFFMGKHYRTTWGAEVKNIPYLDLDTAYGGLTPYSKGGGAQTVSLKFKSGDGQVFAFRPLEKNPNKKLDKELKQTIYGDIMEDFTAHQHPYASLPVGYFMDILGLPHSQPKLFLMPNHPRLGQFREEFAGKFGFLEIKPKKKSKKKNRVAFQGADEVASTFQMYRDLLGDNDNDFDTETYVIARIFDMWISDWDRHQDNWKWLGYDNGKGITYTPFPKDRDKAFSLFQGLYQLMDWELLNKDRGRFRKSYRAVKSLNFKARNMDRILANQYGYKDWMAAVEKFESLMTDEIIEKALLQLPPEIYAVSGIQIAEILKVRRTRLKKAIKNYYSLLAKKITIVGTNDQEIFEIDRLENGNVHVQVFKKTKKGKKSNRLFSRVVKYSETNEINLYGLGKTDEFLFTGETKSSIKVRVISGAGKDLIVDDSKVFGRDHFTKIYDYSRDDSIQFNSEANRAVQNRKELFHVEGFYKDNYAYFIPMISYNIDDKWNVGFFSGKTWQWFGKPDFGMKYTLTARASTNKNYSIVMRTEFREAIKKWDLIADFTAARPYDNLRYFYGLGNETKADEDLFRQSYYRNTTTALIATVGLRRSFWKKSHLILSAKYDYQNVEVSSRNKLESSIYEDLNPTGFGESILYGGDIDFNLDLRDDVAFPTRGAQFKFQNYSFINAKPGSQWAGRMTSEALFYFTRGIKVPTTLGIRTGFSSSYGKMPFYYKSYIGQQFNMRGIRTNRYGGDAAAFVNTDLRFHLGTALTRLLPLRYGIYGLFDAGRVWVEGEDSDKIHFAYGGGIYLIPYVDSFNLNLSIAKPEEGRVLLNFRIGFFVR